MTYINKKKNISKKILEHFFMCWTWIEQQRLLQLSSCCRHMCQVGVWMLLRQLSNYSYFSRIARKEIHVSFKEEKQLLSSYTFTRWESFWEEAVVLVHPFVHRGCQDQPKISFLQLLLISNFSQLLSPFLLFCARNLVRSVPTWLNRCVSNRDCGSSKPLKTQRNATW